MLVFALFVLYKYPKHLLKIGAMSVVALLISAYVAESSFHLKLMSIVDKLLVDMSFGERG